MKAKELFLPFWKFIGLLVFFYALTEFLKDVGILQKSK